MPFYSKEALRSSRFIALLLPYDQLSKNQILRLFSIIKKVGEFKRISSQFDIFIVYILKKITKSNVEICKEFDWSVLSQFVFEQILPGSLKIPSPVKGARKMTKLLSKTDVSLGEEFFESMRSEIPPRIAKWLVYTMETDSYETTIHEKLIFFLDSLRNLCHASNFGSWSIQIELFLGYLAGSLAKQSNTSEKWLNGTSSKLIDEIVEKIWNLSELLIFARSGPALSGLCVSSFTCTNLMNLRPEKIIPKVILSISSALESISEPHRTTSAIGLLQVSMPNLMKHPIGIGPVLSLLPTVVFGIDSNDQLKSIRTLSLFLSFSEAANIENISNLESSSSWTDAYQEAKELTGQFPDIFLVFTENIISYLRNIANDESKGHEDLSKMILAISNCVYSNLSKEIAEICYEKWFELLEEDFGSNGMEIIGEILSKIISNHLPELFDKLIPKIISKISERIERGDGRLGSKDQSNNSLNNNLIILSNLLENGGKLYHDNNDNNFTDNNDSSCVGLVGIILKVLNSITNRKTFLIGSRIFHSIIINLIHFGIKAEKPKIIKENPFENWARWFKAEELENGKDFNWNSPNEFDGEKCLNLIEIILNWTRIQAKTFKTRTDTEKLFCLLQIVDNLNIDLVNVYNSFSSYCSSIRNYEEDIGINLEFSNENIMKRCQNLLKENLNTIKDLKGIIESSGNLEVLIQFIEIIGSVVNGQAVNPEKPRDKLKALKRLNINYDRYYTDKKRPISFWMLKAETQFKLRRDLRFNLGDAVFEASMMKDFNDLSEILYQYCFKPYHAVRSISQSTLRRFAYKYIDKSLGFISKTMDLVESNGNLTEIEFKGVCFLLRSRFIDVISEDLGLIKRFLRCLLKLGDMPVSGEINDSFEILSGTLNTFNEAFVPDERKGGDCDVICDKSNAYCYKELVVELIRIASENNEKWTSQYLALLSAHPMIEICNCPEIFQSLATLSLSKVSIIRTISQNCFKSAMYGFINSIDANIEAKSNLWKYRDLTALKIVHLGKLPNIEFKQIKIWKEKEKEFKDFCKFFKEYLNFSCLREESFSSSGDSSTAQFEYTTFYYLGRWINLLGPKEMEKVFEIIDEIFNSLGDFGRQRAFCEITCSIICNTKYYKDEKIQEYLKRSWNSLAIENSGLWTAAIDEPLMWNELVLKELVTFFADSNDNTAKIVLSLKMIYIIYNQIGIISAWVDIDWLILKLINLCSNEYTTIVMESSKLLALISIRNPEKRERILEDLLNGISSSSSLNLSRSVLQFFACISTITNLSDYWSVLNSKLGILLKMLQSENVQLITDSKKALLTLFLAKGSNLNDLNELSNGIFNFINAGNEEIPVKISKFCIELIQLLLQNNFSLFHVTGAVDTFMKVHVDKLIESDKVHFRESSHGLLLTLYQIDQKKSVRDIEKITKSLQGMKFDIRGEKGFKERHGMIVRGSAIVLSEPHLISKSLPALLTALSNFISDKSPISQLVRMTFSEFRRTHQENWHCDRQLFDEDQLDAIGELLIAPSYYA